MQSHSIRALYMPSGDCTWGRRTLLPNQDAALVLCRDRSSRAFPAPQACSSPRPCPNSRLGSWRLQGRRSQASRPTMLVNFLPNFGAAQMLTMQIVRPIQVSVFLRRHGLAPVTRLLGPSCVSRLSCFPEARMRPDDLFDASDRHVKSSRTCMRSVRTGGHSFHQSGHRAIPRSHLVVKSGALSLASKTAVGESTHCAGRTASRRRPLATFRIDTPVQPGIEATDGVASGLR